MASPVIALRLPPESANELRARAAASGCSLSQFVRQRLFAPSVDAQHRAPLQRIAERTGRHEGDVLNRIVRDFIESDLTYDCEDEQGEAKR